VHSIYLADDTQVYMKFTNVSVAAQVDNMQACLTERCQWFLSNGLAINPDKSEAIVLSTAQRSRHTNSVSSTNQCDHLRLRFESCLTYGVLQVLTKKVKKVKLGYIIVHSKA